MPLVCKERREKISLRDCVQEKNNFFTIKGRGFGSWHGSRRVLSRVKGVQAPVTYSSSVTTLF